MSLRYVNDFKLQSIGPTCRQVDSKLTLTPKQQFEKRFVIKCGDLVETISGIYQVTVLNDDCFKVLLLDLKNRYEDIIAVYRKQKNGHLMCLWLR